MPSAKKSATQKPAANPKTAVRPKAAPAPAQKNIPVKTASKTPAPAKTAAPAPKPAAPAKPAAPVKPAAPAKPVTPAKPAPAPAPIVIRPFSRSAETKKAAELAQSSRQQKLSPTEIKKLRAELVASRNRLTTKTSTMRQVALERNDEINTEEDSIDQFERLFEIEKIASVQEIVYLIDEALRALDEGVYGVCQKCGATIEKARILALPFAKTCIRCQSEAERLKNR